MQRIEFKRVKVGAEFNSSGNKWLKRSTRTAVLLEPIAYAGTWFYFSMNQRVVAL